ncbi:FadR family transcriptional regulator [Psychrosphaera sp. B3R10]|uniref:FadR/GntR family transcriptional regulator n=1 Tax=unclassified Psychrosphaera TaxID=2641570 RepID=UPI001C095DD1|nr:FadR/GntR family transcriptional regulator [Psychrosphaera sp. 1_MG-2023]MBU2881040.1 FadR family transcriptional regulator [Psychrosphaera sp. I2R16]MBU2989964.1 FadR family transcriptional regulator [Psychrosphaera sp. B3R10]MDO6719145.1 FadR/GntR family transcriptional regulator [Psychrosphaera sp. 1_MG-2023]
MELETIKIQRLYVKVAEQISRLVQEGELKPGDRLPSERELAEKIGVSRPTIREAMIALEIAGIIEIRTGSGIYVVEQKPELALSDEGVGPFEVLDTRYIIEAEACALAAARITEEQLEELNQTIKEMEEEEKRPDASEKADMKFHMLIAEASQNSAISAIVKWLWELRNQSALSKAFMARLREEGIHPSINEHKRIVDALAKRNPEKARNAMKAHIEGASDAAATYFSSKK